MMSELTKLGELDCTVVDRSNGTVKAAIILCHGFGAPGTDLVGFADEMIRASPKLRDAVFVFPRAPIELDPFYDSRAWWLIDIEKIQSLMMRGEFRELRQSVPGDLETRRQQMFSVIDHVVENFNVSAERVVIGGFSQGAMLTTDVALNYPQSLGGLIIWSGTLMNESQWIAAAEKKSPISIVQSHGRIDPILPFAGAEFLRDMLTEHEHQVDFVPFQGQHGIAAEAIHAARTLIESVI